MPTQYPDLFAALAAPFETHEVRARNQGGRQVQYITARTAMNRLDAVLGPENWWDEYLPGDNSVLCRLTVKLPDGTILTKADAGGYAGMSDQGDDEKSGFSDSFKRAAVKFGVGRYLYRDGVPDYRMAHDPAADSGPPPKVKGTWGPANADALPMPPPAPAPVAKGGKAGNNDVGKRFFDWCREQERIHGLGLVKYLNGWSKPHRFPGRIVDWDAEQTKAGHAEALRKIEAISLRGDAYEDVA